MVLERSINKDKLAKHQLEYSIKLADAGNDGMEVRGLMVIKKTKKTRARQRKNAVSNWKVTLFCVKPHVSGRKSFSEELCFALAFEAKIMQLK